MLELQKENYCCRTLGEWKLHFFKLITMDTLIVIDLEIYVFLTGNINISGKTAFETHGNFMFLN
jgi:hypothetical protein